MSDKRPNTMLFRNADRYQLADQLEAEIRPLINTYKEDGGYDCCGCSTYALILDHVIRIVSKGTMYAEESMIPDKETETSER